MAGGPTEEHRAALSSLGSSLEPALRAECGGRLGEVRWFQADWQRGGASTAYSEWTFDDGQTREVLIKAPVGPVERRITTELSDTDAHTPVVVASGVEMGGYDLAWLIMERVPGNPLSHEPPSRKLFLELFESAAGFYRVEAALHRPDGVPERTDWESLLEKARHDARESDIAHQQHWNDLIKQTQKLLPRLLPIWRGRDSHTWRHGDLHIGNAMRRPDGSAWGPAGCVLLDFAEVGLGHWVEDAIYLERLYWANPEKLCGVKPVKELARARKQQGLENGEDYNDLANIRRALLSACVPAFLHREGHPVYLEASLRVLEQTLPLVHKL
ncbi:MAG: aminoglycoside phosphotransferase family protein [Phycisphaeraceae bacterium]|nr:aminoglycoside phosphotransferase family protein [Phycisphaeraceae bacterium]